MPCSLKDICNGCLCIGRKIFQTFLGPFNYHCWWQVKLLILLYYLDYVFVNNKTASCPYLLQVNARGIIIIDTKGFVYCGFVLLYSNWMVEVSSIKKGCIVKKDKNTNIYHNSKDILSILIVLN